jgi:hypothetical protein
MAVFTATDGVTAVTITSVGVITHASPELRALITAVYRVHAIAPYGRLHVLDVPSSVDEYEITWDTLDGRQLKQRIKNPGFTGWSFRQEKKSDYFTLAEILAHNFVRSAIQDLIDAFAVSELEIEF